MNIGYARVSTVGQDYDTQRELLEAASCEKIFKEKITGTSTAQRKELKAAIDYAREGDTLIVTKIDRLARSIFDLNNIVGELLKKGVTVQFLSENMEFKPEDKNLRSSSMQSLMFNILGSFAQFERDLIVERTSEGRERAKAQGKHMGRKASYSEKDMDKAVQQYLNRKENGMSVNDILKVNEIPKASLYVQLKKIEKREINE